MTLSLTVIPVPGHGAEDVVVDAEGWVYTGTDDGSVFRVRPDGGRIDRVGNTTGRPLGLELLPDGRLLVCDARRGLLALDCTTGDIEVLAGLVHGRRLLFCNNAAVHSNGDIWFSDSSRRARHRPVEGRPGRGHRHRPAAAASGRRAGRGGRRGAALRQRRGPARPTSPSSPSPSPPAGPSYDAG